jgi:hypothetical protein
MEVKLVLEVWAVEKVALMRSYSGGPGFEYVTSFLDFIQSHSTRAGMVP